MVPRFFPAFFDKPQHISFAEQETNERIELFLRQHWFTNVGWILGTTIAFFVPPVAITLDVTLGFNLLRSIPTEILTGAIIIWYMLVVAYAIQSFLYWYYNIYIVTNFHLVDVDFLNLLFRQVTEIELKDVESVRNQISGVIRPLFNYGDVIIETAAKDQSEVFEDVPRPDLVADRIEDLRGGLPEGDTE